MSSQILRKGALTEGYQPPPPSPSDDDTINVALFPYVFEQGAFVAAVQALWEEKTYPYKLRWSYFEPYYEEPKSLDVFALDCIYIDDFMAAGWVDRIARDDVAGLDDLLPYAQANVALDPQGKTFGAIPYLGCTNVLFYRDGDSELGKAGPLTIAELLKAIGKAEYSTPQPPPGKGLLLDLKGRTTIGGIYAAAWRALEQVWWEQPVPMPMPAELEAPLLQCFQEYLTMTGAVGGEYKDPNADRITWFAEGYGRACVGFPEFMRFIEPDALEKVHLRPLPVSLEGGDEHVLCFADALALRPGMDKEKRAAALELANLIASKEVARLALMYDGFHAQYLTPVRNSVLEMMEQSEHTGPKYRELGAILRGGGYKPVPYRLGKGAREWVPAIGGLIEKALFPQPEVAAEAEARPRRRPHGHHRTPAGIWRRGD